MCRLKKRITLLISVIIFVSCGPKKGIVTKKTDSKPVSKVEVSKPKSSAPETSEVIIEDAKESIVRPRNKTTGSIVDNYISNYAEIAKTEMKKYGIPASITLAQGILESGSGNGRLAKEANNHFGIKCHDWTGAKIYHDDDKSDECFRKYNEPFLSYEDHSRFLTGRSRYASLFDLKPDDYKGWAKGLKKAGYATDRNYPKKLIGLIERYDLDRFDKEVLKSSKGRSRIASKPSQENRASSQSNITHEVMQGETLYSLARIYNTTVDSIIKLNDLPGSDIKIGQILVIKSNK